MSQTKTILNYIQQNNRQNSQLTSADTSHHTYASISGFSTARDKPAPTLPKRRVPLARKFPFSQCADVSLKQSRESITQGVKLAVNQYRKLVEILSLQNYVHSWINNASSDSHPSQIMDSDEHVIEELREMLKLPSILVKHEQSNREKLVAKFQEVVKVCLEKKLGIEPRLMEDSRVREALNYATNLFLQEFKSATTKGLCSELSRGYTSGELAEALNSLAYDFMDKYEETALDHFEDMVFDGTSRAALKEPGATVEKPVFFDYFRAIWKLDPPNALEFNVNHFIENYEGVESHFYSSQQVLDICPDKYGEFAVKMNILRFYWNYRDELQARNETVSKAVPDDLHKMDEFALLRDMVEQLMLSEEQKPVSRPKAKSLRFGLEPLVMN